MGFDVKRIFRMPDRHKQSKDKGKNTQAQSPNQTDTDSPSEGDGYSNTINRGANPGATSGVNTPRAGASHAAHTTTSSSSSIWNLRSSGNTPTDPPSSSRGLRSKASRIGRSKESKDRENSKESGGYFNSTASGGAGQKASAAEAELEKLFDELRNPTEDPKNELGVESTMGYMMSLGLNPETSDVFVALEIVQAPSLGEITRKGFVDGWKAAGATHKPCYTLEDQKAYIAMRVQQFGVDPAFFKKIYRYTFAAGKEADQRSMSLENAIEFWKVLFATPGRPWVSTATNKDWTPVWIDFLTEKWTRSVNRDMWNQTLEFANKSIADPSLSFWSEDGAWPSVIDDFVAWSRANNHASTDESSVNQG